VDYPQFFSYIAAIIGNFLFIVFINYLKYTNILHLNVFFIAPSLLSQNASFGFNNLKDSCASIRPDNSSIFFMEVLNKIHSFEETQNIKEVSDSLVICFIFLLFAIVANKSYYL